MIIGWILILFFTAKGSDGGVAMHDIAFGTRAACEAARTAALEATPPAMFNPRLVAICVANDK